MPVMPIPSAWDSVHRFDHDTQFRYVNTNGSSNNNNASNALYVCVGSYFSQSEYLLRESSAEWIEGWPDLPKGKYSSRHGRADAACMVMVFGDP